MAMPAAGVAESTIPPPAMGAERVREFQDLRSGMFICWSFSTISGYEWPPGVEDINFFHPFINAACLVISSGGSQRAMASQLHELPLAPQRGAASDWLLDDSAFQAAIYRTENPNEITLENGLVRRTFRLAPNAATVGLDHLVTGHAVLRAVRPEAEVTIDGVTYPVGGLTGQPNHAFLVPEWLDTMHADPAAFLFTGFEIGKPRTLCLETRSPPRTRRHLATQGRASANALPHAGSAGRPVRRAGQ
jgi:hypothetical protein